MKPEELEPLLLDRALGELSPAVAELLDAHLASHPSAAQQVAAYAATLQIARQASVVPAKGALRPFDTTRIRRAERQRRWRSTLGELTKLAACVALGLVLGQVVRPAQPGQATLPLRVASASVTSESRPGPELRFWSMDTLAAEHRLQSARPGRRGRAYTLHWESPVKMPRLEELP